MTKGTIHELGERQCGLIRRVGVKEHLFFHADGLVGIAWGSLKKGDKVCFTVVQSRKGPYAIQVSKT
ncbi:MAG: cold shock domain-containing protein [Minisyncoccia bacterium]